MENVIEQAVLEYIALKAQMEQIEGHLKRVRPVIEDAVPLGETKVIAGHKISHTEAIRENFQLKAARFTVPAEVLAPFITISTYTQLRVK